MHKVLIIDDERDICFLISEILKDEDYITSSSVNSDEAIKNFAENKPDLIILDVWLANSKLDGIELLQKFKNMDNKIPIIIISGHGTVDLAVKSIKNGAYDFLEKPFNSDKLIILAKRAVESSELINENKDLKNIVVPNIPLIGNSNFTKKVAKVIIEQSSSNSRLFISGAFGTGKKHIANLIHQRSSFREKLPVSIDFNRLSNDALHKLFSDKKEYLNENLFIRSK
jgi:Response regulator containing CheY-like receiver, AAA-type ATPase, and DNA-binding domains